MDWTITEVEKNGDYITLTATAEIPLKELQAVLEGAPETTSSKVVKTTKPKKARAKPKGKAKDFDKKAYMKAYHAKRKAAKEKSAPTVEVTGEDPSQEKQDRMEALDKQIKKAQAEQGKMYGRERP